jgi:hypothetical protein
MTDEPNDVSESAHDNAGPPVRLAPRASGPDSAILGARADTRSKAALARVRRRGRLVIFLAVIAGAGLVLLATARYGAGISPDSVTYIDVARSLLSGKGFVTHDGSPYLLWPPLYPALLASLGFITGRDPAVFVHILNAVLFALVTCLSARLLQTSLRRTTTYGVLAACAVLFSIPLSDVYRMAWADCLLVPLALLYLVSAQRYWSGGGLGALAAMTVSAGLALLTSYRGMAVIPSGVLTIILASGTSFGTRVRRACAFAGLSLVPIGLWLVHRPRVVDAWLRIEYLPGVQDPRGFPILLADNLAACVRTILSWYLPGRAVWLVVPACAAAAAVASSWVIRGRPMVRARSVLSYTPGVLLSATYILVLVSLASAKHIPYVEPRYLSPLYVPVTLALLELATRFLRPTWPSARPFARKAPAMLLVLWLLIPAVSVVRSTAHRFRNGAGGYSIRKWHESETVAYVKRTLSGGNDVHLYSNLPSALWVLAGVNAAASPDSAAGDPRQMEGRWPAADEALLVWFTNVTWRTYLIPIEELKGIADFDEVAHLGDGSVYRVSPKRPAVGDLPEPRN